MSLHNGLPFTTLRKNLVGVEYWDGPHVWWCEKVRKGDFVRPHQIVAEMLSGGRNVGTISFPKAGKVISGPFELQILYYQKHVDLDFLLSNPMWPLDAYYNRLEAENASKQLAESRLKEFLQPKKPASLQNLLNPPAFPFAPPPFLFQSSPRNRRPRRLPRKVD